MHYASVKWICFLLFVVVGKVAMAEGITSLMEISVLSLP